MDKTGAVDTLLQEERVFRPLPQMLARARVSQRDLEAAYERAAADPLGFWEEAARELSWFSEWDAVLDESDPPFYRWFTGATCNIVHNALDRHVHTVNKNRLALIWEGETGETRKYTYFELYRAVNRLASAFRSLGLSKGDRIVIYMPQIPETVMAMLAAAKIGAVHCVVFAGLSARALRERVADAGASCVVSADGYYRNGRLHSMKKLVDEALNDPSCKCASSVVVVRRTGVDVDMTPGRDIWYEDLIRSEGQEALTEVMDSEDPLFLLYTSGTTGKPRGVVHTHGGYMVGVARTFGWVFDVKPTDIFWSTAELGWITGHTAMVYGPLLNGTTTVMYEGHPLYPQADRIWHMVAKYGISILYTTPTLIRMLMRHGSRFPRQHDLSCLRLLGSVGEPLPPDAWVWFHRHVGRGECPLLDTWWQTETGMFMLSPMPVSLLKPGSVSKPLPGVAAEVVDYEGNPVPSGKGGYLAVTRPWPAMLRTLWNDDEGFRKTYFERLPGMFFAGDVARKDADGFFWIQGRADEVINIAGHNIGTAEIEAALMEHEAVNEAAVIGVPDEIKGQLAKAFVVLCRGYAETPELAELLREHVRLELGPIATVRSVEFREELPRNRAGKIMRRVLKAQDQGQDPGDLSTLEF